MGFKLHMVVNNKGAIMAVKITKINIVIYQLQML